MTSLQHDQRANYAQWGQRLLAALMLSLAVCLAWAWVDTFYRGAPVNAQLSFKADEQPYPGNLPLAHSAPIIHEHYFGDFEVPWSYAIDLRHGVSPYLRYAPEQYPPFAQVLFVPFSLLPLRTAIVVFFVLSALVFLVPLWLLLELGWEQRTIFLVPVAVLTVGFGASLDRGNDMLIAAGLISWALWAWRKERWVWCGVFLVAAIGLKAAPAALLVVPFALRRYKFTMVVALATAATNAVVVALFPGGLVKNARAFLPALKTFNIAQFNILSWSAWSVVPKAVGFLGGHPRADPLLVTTSPLIWVPSILYVAGVFVVIRRGRVPQWCWGPLALATGQLLVPATYAYATTWATLGAVWFATASLVDVPDRDETFLPLRVLLVAVFVVTLTPSVFTISASGFAAPAATFLSPVLLYATAIVAVGYSCKRDEAPRLPEGSRGASYASLS